MGKYIPGGDAFRFVGIIRSLLERTEDSSVPSKILNKLNYAKYGKIENSLLRYRNEIDTWVKSNWDRISKCTDFSNETGDVEIERPDEYCPHLRIRAYNSEGRFLVYLHPSVGMKTCGLNHQYHNHPESLTETDLLDGIKGIILITSFDSDLSKEFKSFISKLIKKPNSKSIENEESNK